MCTEVFGIQIRYEVWNKQESLPLYISGNYDFQTAYIEAQKCIMITPTSELATIPALKKQISRSRCGSCYFKSSCCILLQKKKFD